MGVFFVIKKIKNTLIYIFTKFLLKQFFSESRNIKIKTSNHFLRYLNVTENIKDYRRWWLIYYIDKPPKNHRNHIPYTPHLLKICACYQDEKCLPSYAKTASYHTWCVKKERLSYYQVARNCLPARMVGKSIALKCTENQYKQTDHIG